MTQDTIRAHFPLTLAASGGRQEYSARFIRAGRITRADGEPGPFTVPAAAIQHAIAEQMFEGLACFVDHPGWFQNASLRNLAGITASAQWNAADQSADGVIRLYPTGAGEIVSDLFDAMLQDAEAGEPIPNIGLSLTFYPRWKPRDNEDDPLTLKTFKRILSVDFVFTPAADGRIKEALSALSALGSPPPDIQQLIVEATPAALEGPESLSLSQVSISEEGVQTMSEELQNPAPATPAATEDGQA
jgi:hypothetical protein